MTDDDKAVKEITGHTAEAIIKHDMKVDIPKVIVAMAKKIYQLEATIAKLEH